jgi:hydrogenase maturation factor
MYDRLQEAMPALIEMAEQLERDPPAVRIRRAVAGFTKDHPDAIRDADGNRVYSGDFRDFVVAMRDPGEPGESLASEEIALASGVPLELYEEWVRSRH